MLDSTITVGEIVFEIASAFQLTSWTQLKGKMPIKIEEQGFQR